MPDKLSLLVIEDSPAERALVDAALADFPAVERRMVSSLREGQNLIDTATPDVVLLDLELPDARGLDGITWLLRRNPDLPIVVLSGFGADDLLLAGEAVRLGAQDFIGKGRLGGSELMRALYLARVRKARELEARTIALRDPLTGLPGPALLAERFLDSVSRSRRNGAGLALLHLDVDGYSALEAALGCDVAEARLIELSGRLAGELRRTDVMARLDGAGFLTLVEAMKSSCDGYVIARRLLSAARQPLGDADATTPLRLSIGVAVRDCEADDFRTLRTRAEAAMYLARREGGDRYATAVQQAIAAE